MSIQDLSTFAAVRATPCWMTAGKVTPIGAVPAASPNERTISATTAATAPGVEGDGVGVRTRSAVKVPAARSTGHPLMPEPPMSMPKPLEGPATTVMHAAYERSCGVPPGCVTAG